jgi:hypothetical protein
VSLSGPASRSLDSGVSGVSGIRLGLGSTKTGESSSPAVGGTDNGEDEFERGRSLEEGRVFGVHEAVARCCCLRSARSASVGEEDDEVELAPFKLVTDDIDGDVDDDDGADASALTTNTSFDNGTEISPRCDSNPRNVESARFPRTRSSGRENRKRYWAPN